MKILRHSLFKALHIETLLKLKLLLQNFVHISIFLRFNKLTFHHLKYQTRFFLMQIFIAVTCSLLKFKENVYNESYHFSCYKQGLSYNAEGNSRSNSPKSCYFLPLFIFFLFSSLFLLTSFPALYLSPPISTSSPPSLPFCSLFS